MNRKGQSLITFVLILPIIALILAFLIEGGLALVEKKEIEGSIYDNMKIILNNNIRDKEKIMDVLSDTDNDYDVVITDEYIKINGIVKGKRVFNKVSILNNKICYVGDYQSKEIKKEC